ncbi:MAG: hypothetical protein U5Q03_00910 [Bacteroidota bacterium]|nr:hypothetical protein [Bacteroidota bacterium]
MHIHILRSSIDKNYLHLPPIDEIFGNKLIENVQQPMLSGNIRFNIDEFISEPSVIFIKGWAFPEKVISGDFRNCGLLSKWI